MKIGFILLLIVLVLYKSVFAFSVPDSLRLRRDGLYNTYDTSFAQCGDRWSNLLISQSPLIVINGTNMHYSFGGGARDYTFFKLKYYSDIGIEINSMSGTYIINYDKISSILPIVLSIRGMRPRVFTAYFEGTIKNRDTILNWHMVPPYPDAPAKFNDNFKDLLQPKMLYFIQSKELLGLDSLYQMRLREAQQNKTK